MSFVERGGFDPVKFFFFRSGQNLLWRRRRSKIHELDCQAWVMRKQIWEKGDQETGQNVPILVPHSIMHEASKGNENSDRDLVCLGYICEIRCLALKGGHKAVASFYKMFTRQERPLRIRGKSLDFKTFRSHLFFFFQVRYSRGSTAYLPKASVTI